jgi:C2H2-type zinc finger
MHPDIVSYRDQGEPGVDYDEPNLNPLICDICKQEFDSLDKLGEHQKQAHDM